ncbi:hrpB domain protein [Burkholderia mallei]|nr:hrpB domain protein [Burkholderia mallei]
MDRRHRVAAVQLLRMVGSALRLIHLREAVQDLEMTVMVPDADFVRERREHHLRDMRRVADQAGERDFLPGRVLIGRQAVRVGPVEMRHQIVERVGLPAGEAAQRGPEIEARAQQRRAHVLFGDRAAREPLALDGRADRIAQARRLPVHVIGELRCMPHESLQIQIRAHRLRELAPQREILVRGEQALDRELDVVEQVAGLVEMAELEPHAHRPEQPLDAAAGIDGGLAGHVREAGHRGAEPAPEQRLPSGVAKRQQTDLVLRRMHQLA